MFKQKCGDRGEAGRLGGESSDEANRTNSRKGSAKPSRGAAPKASLPVVTLKDQEG